MTTRQAYRSLIEYYSLYLDGMLKTQGLVGCLNAMKYLVVYHSPESSKTYRTLGKELLSLYKNKKAFLQDVKETTLKTTAQTKAQELETYSQVWDVLFEGITLSAEDNDE